MKFHTLFGCLILALVASAGALEPVENSSPSVIREMQDLSDQLRSAKDQMADLEKRLDAVERRLGETYRASTPFNTIERRLEDIEKELERR